MNVCAGDRRLSESIWTTQYKLGGIGVQASYTLSNHHHVHDAMRYLDRIATESTTRKPINH